MERRLIMVGFGFWGGKRESSTLSREGTKVGLDLALMGS